MPTINSVVFGGVPVIDVAFANAWDDLRSACVALMRIVSESEDGDEDESDEELNNANLDLDWAIRNLYHSMVFTITDHCKDYDIMNTIEAYEILDRWMQDEMDEYAKMPGRDKGIVRALWATTTQDIHDLKASIARLSDGANDNVPEGFKATPRRVRLASMDWNNGFRRPPRSEPWNGHSIWVSSRKTSAGTLCRTWIDSSCDAPLSSGDTMSL